MGVVLRNHQQNLDFTFELIADQSTKWGDVNSIHLGCAVALGLIFVNQTRRFRFAQLFLSPYAFALASKVQSGEWQLTSC